LITCGAYLYYDAQARRRRLTLTIVRTAALEFDRVVANGCRLVSLARMRPDA